MNFDKLNESLVYLVVNIDVFVGRKNKEMLKKFVDGVEKSLWFVWCEDIDSS